jgi:hypothetical protein
MQLGDEHGVELQRRGVVDELRRLPAGGAHGEVIEAEGELGTGGGTWENDRCSGGARDCARKERRFMPRMLAESILLSISESWHAISE